MLILYHCNSNLCQSSVVHIVHFKSMALGIVTLFVLLLSTAGTEIGMYKAIFVSDMGTAGTIPGRWLRHGLRKK